MTFRVPKGLKPYRSPDTLPVSAADFNWSLTPPNTVMTGWGAPGYGYQPDLGVQMNSPFAGLPQNSLAAQYASLSMPNNGQLVGSTPLMGNQTSWFTPNMPQPQPQQVAHRVYADTGNGVLGFPSESARDTYFQSLGNAPLPSTSGVPPKKSYAGVPMNQLTADQYTEFLQDNRPDPTMGYISAGLQGAQTVGDLIMGWRAMSQAREALDFQKKAYNDNLLAQKKSYNQAQSDRVMGMVSSSDYNNNPSVRAAVDAQIKNRQL